MLAVAVREALGVGEASGRSSAEGLAGREAELALAAAAVRQLSEEQASVLVIEGEAGIGKTRLVQSIADDARSRDVAVFCGSNQAAVSFGVEDLDGLKAMLSSVPPEMAAQAESHGSSCR